MDGYEATRLVRESGAALAIVALTANAMAGDRDRCLAAGMNAFVSKAVELERLASVLTTWLPHPPEATDAEREAVNQRRMSSIRKAC